MFYIYFIFYSVVISGTLFWKLECLSLRAFSTEKGEIEEPKEWLVKNWISWEDNLLWLVVVLGGMNMADQPKNLETNATAKKKICLISFTSKHNLYIEMLRMFLLFGWAYRIMFQENAFAFQKSSDLRVVLWRWGL